MFGKEIAFPCNILGEIAFTVMVSWINCHQDFVFNIQRTVFKKEKSGRRGLLGDCETRKRSCRK